MAESFDLSIQKVPYVIGRDKVTKEPKITLSRLKDLTFTNGAETVALTAGGTPLAHFGHSKTFGMSGTNATINGSLMALQLGTNVVAVASSTEIRINEIVTVDVADTATLSYVPTGTAGEELLWAEIIDSTNTPTATLQQAAAVAAGKFTVTAKALAFETGEAPVGTRIRVSYYPTASNVKKIKNMATEYSTTLDWDVHCRFLNVCTKEEVKGYMHVPSGFLEGSFEWATGETSDPAIVAFSLMAEQGCLDSELYTLHIYSEDDLV